MLKENQRIFNVTRVVLDACICLISMVLAFVIRFNVLDGGHDRIGIVYYLRLMVLVIPFYFLLYQYFGLHDSFRSKALVSEIGKIVQANMVGSIFIFVLVFFLKEVNVSRMVVVLFAGMNTLFGSIERVAIRKILRRLREDHAEPQSGIRRLRLSERATGKCGETQPSLSGDVPGPFQPFGK